MENPKKIAVAMSGGVDSSLAAALLIEQGYDVEGFTLDLWKYPSKYSLSNKSVDQAKHAADYLKIPIHLIDATNPFYDLVIGNLYQEYSQANTPNPCVICNKRIKWGFLSSFVNEMGISYLATGHYATIEKGETGLFELWKGKDRDKDQSYFLSYLSQEDLSNTCFPVGKYMKSEVRDIARKRNIPSFDREESQDLCFLNKDNIQSFLADSFPELTHPGDIIDNMGRILGKHRGLAFYTIGQRKGLGLSNPEPLYVIAKDVKENKLIVGTRQYLGKQKLLATDLNWIIGKPPKGPFGADVKIRYKSDPVKANILFRSNHEIEIDFEHAIRDITPGQFAVMYKGDQVIGAGKIISSF